MGRRLIALCAGAAGLLAVGCGLSGPLFDNPILVRPAAAGPMSNPTLIELGTTGEAYRKIIEKTIDVLTDYRWPIAEINPYAGLIRTHPTIAPGYEQWFKPGSPDSNKRLLATLQSIRQYAVVKIDVARDGGYWVDVKVFVELEDVDRPIRATAGAAAFRSDDQTVDHQFEVIDPVPISSGWIPLGEDEALEQEILAPKEVLVIGAAATQKPFAIVSIGLASLGENSKNGW